MSSRRKDAHVVKIICSDRVRNVSDNPKGMSRTVRSARGVRIFIDRKELTHIKNATLYMPVDNVIKLEVEFMPHAVDVLVEGVDIVAKVTRKGLKAKLERDDYEPDVAETLTQWADERGEV